MPILRIAPVCNGKIYVVPHSSDNEGIVQMDIPIEEYVSQIPSSSGKTAGKIADKYRLHLHTDSQPRFSVKYRTDGQAPETVYLYILPLKDEDEISFSEGHFISAGDISANSNGYAPNLQKESELLGMAAELWKDYFSSMTE